MPSAPAPEVTAPAAAATGRRPPLPLRQRATAARGRKPTRGTSRATPARPPPPPRPSRADPWDEPAHSPDAPRDRAEPTPGTSPTDRRTADASRAPSRGRPLGPAGRPEPTTARAAASRHRRGRPLGRAGLHRPDDRPRRASRHRGSRPLGPAGRPERRRPPPPSQPPPRRSTPGTSPPPQSPRPQPPPRHPRHPRRLLPKADRKSKDTANPWRPCPARRARPLGLSPNGMGGRNRGHGPGFSDALARPRAGSPSVHGIRRSQEHIAGSGGSRRVRAYTALTRRSAPDFARGGGVSRGRWR